MFSAGGSSTQTDILNDKSDDLLGSFDLNKIVSKFDVLVTVKLILSIFLVKKIEQEDFLCLTLDL